MQVQEVQRMDKGGNKPWKDFFDAHASNQLTGRTFEGSTIAERYDSDAGEEWKERLTCKVEGREYVPGTTSSGLASRAKPQQSTPTASRSQTPLSRSSAATPQRGISPSQKARNEDFFARKGHENDTRPADLPPSQGGKYAGFGSEPPSSTTNTTAAAPALSDFEKDPMGALTKGFGWLSSTVTKQATAVHKSYVAPNLQKLAEADLASQARNAAVTAGSTLQQGTRGLQQNFERFVDPEAAAAGGKAAPEKKDFWDSFGAPPAGPPKDKRDFWDDFSNTAGEVTQSKAAAKPTAIGTAAMRPAGGKKEGDEWGEW